MSTLIIIIIILTLCCCISSGAGAYLLFKDHTLYTEKVQLLGNDLTKSDNIQTIEECRKLCFDNTQCQSFDYNPTSKQCYLKTSTKVTGDKPKALTAYKLEGNGFTGYDGYAMDDIGTANLPDMPINNISQEECQTKCKNNADCKLYKYVYGSNPKSCVLKSYRANELYTHGNLERRDLNNVNVDPKPA